MKLIFQQHPDDLKDLWKNNLQRTGQRNKILVITLLAAVLFIWQISGSDDTWKTLLSWILPFIAIMVILWISLKLVQKRLLNNGKDPLLTGYREVELLEEGIRYKTHVSDAVFQWDALTQLSESPKNYFLYMGKQRAIIIPKSAFIPSTLEQEFIDLLKTKDIYFR